MQLSIQADIKAAEKALGALKKQVPFAAAFAMTKTAQKVKQIELIEMDYAFKKTSRYTRGALYVKRAEKRDFERGTMQSDVWLIGQIGRRNRHYLYPQVHGGQRDHGGFERRLISAGLMRSDEYIVKGKHMGRITKGMYQKMLAQLRAYNDPYQNATNSTRSRKNRRAQAFFISRQSKPAGIWMRQGKKLVPVFIFVKRAMYKPRYAFFDIANKVANKYWPTAFNQAIAHAIKTAK